MSEPTTAAKLAALAAAVTVTALPVDTNPVLGVPVDVLLAACAGALFGLAYTKPETWRRFMARPDATAGQVVLHVVLRALGLGFTLACNALLAGWAVAILPHLPLVPEGVSRIAPQPFAGVLAFLGQFLIPKVISWVEGWTPPWSRR